FTATATTYSYTLSLHDALPIFLIDQTMVNDFRPFKNTMAKLSTASRTIEADDGSTGEIANALDQRRRIDTSYEIYLGLYQAITGDRKSTRLNSSHRTISYAVFC